MNAIYFPFTYISEPAVKTITTMFKPLTVYLPTAKIIPMKMKTLSAEGRLDLRTPVEKDEKTLLAANQEYLEWGNTHQKNILSSLKHRTETPYLFDDSWASQIKTDIQKKFNKETGFESDSDFTARLFLLITQEHDQYHHEMTQDVQSIEEMEKSLFKDLRAEDFTAIPEESAPLSTGSQDLGIYMTKERLSSWYRLMKHDHTPPSRFFLTTSPGIWEYLLDFLNDVEIITEDALSHSKKTISKEQDQNLEELIHLLQVEKWPSSNSRIYTKKITSPNGNELNVQFLIIPDTQPENFFSNFMQKTPDHIMSKPTNFRNTVIGIIQQTIQ